MNLTKNIRLGHASGDDARVQRRKNMAVLVICLVMVSTFLFSLTPGRPALFKILDYTAILFEAFSIFMLLRFKSTTALFWVSAPAIISVQYFFLLMNGNTEGDILAFLMVPVAAVVVFGPERSWSWFWVCIVPLAAAPFLEGILPGWTSSLAVTDANPDGSLFYHPEKRSFAVGEGLAMAVGAGCLYLLVFSVHKQLEGASDIIAAQNVELEREHKRSELLLSNMLPASAVQRLKSEPDKTISDDLLAVTILFADIVGFTALASKRSAPELVVLLNMIFSRFDRLVDAEGLEKIKTIGDAYMAVGGAPEPRDDHALAVARLALAMQNEISMIASETGEELSLRIGLASGPATAGVIGTRKPFYDIWGDTVNMASRMESTGEAGRVQMAASTQVLLDDAFICEDRGTVDVKGRGKVSTYYLDQSKLALGEV